VEDAIEAGGGHYLGVALVDVDVAQTELKRRAANYSIATVCQGSSPAKPYWARPMGVSVIGVDLGVG